MIYKSYVKPGKSLRVITLVREPVANNVSMFFQLIDQYLGTSLEQCPLDIDQIIQVFLDRYLHTRPLTWLDAELKTTLGVDVYRSSFPQARGYQIISQNNVQLLVLKCELDDPSQGTAIAEFLGLDHFEIVRSNVTSHKRYADRYAEFKQRIHVPAPLLNRIYESKYALHFYSDAERATFRRRWE